MKVKSTNNADPIDTNAVQKYFDGTESRKHLSYGLEYQSDLLGSIVSSLVRAIEINKVLDVAAGTGSFSELVARSLTESSFIIVDVSHRSLVDSAFDLRIQANADYLPIKDRSIDLLLCRQGLHYVNIVKTTSEFYRVLESNGLLILCNEWWLFGDENQEELDYLSDFVALRNKPKHNLLSRQEIIKAIEFAGFQILQRSDNFSTRFVPLKDWLTLYDTKESELATRRLSLLENLPPSYRVRGYPFLNENTVTFTSKWVVIVATPASDSGKTNGLKKHE